MKTWPTWISILIVAVVFGFFVYGSRSAGWSTHQIVGMAIAVPALCLWMLARVQLRKSFAISAQAKELVTHGLYSKIQNPVYVFGAIGLAGFIVYFNRPWFFLIFLIIIPMQVMRIRNERRVLEAKFGEAYREYRRRTWF
ncbi:MAG TPA: isoprenylcysteine carboxylmethyltransferase family protein [Candidatus Acidoferrales bacterium]|nr:isoprenylcysteine carboxylmethyltransferase family protein [Candidatus Acidoferrales bacterium]